jgi:hypothetical protein
MFRYSLGTPLWIVLLAGVGCSALAYPNALGSQVAFTATVFALLFCPDYS